MIQFRLKQFSEFIEKLFASTEDKLLSYSETSCREIIKCMEMWQEDSVMHWINDVALSQYGIIKRSNNSFANLFACCSGINRINDFGLKRSMINLLKDKNPEETVKRLKEEIITEKNSNGSLKYKSHLKTLKDFKFSDKFYVSFFTILCYLVNGQISVSDAIENLSIDNFGKISGNINKYIKGINPLFKDKLIQVVSVYINSFQEKECGSKDIREQIINYYLDSNENN